MHKMYLISAEGYKHANVKFLTIKNISDLVLKEIYGICETKNHTKEQVNEYKMIKKEKFIKSLII